MRVSITALAAALLPCTDALQLTRRQLAGAAAFGFVPAARADVPVDPFNSMCLGFGCNSPQGVDSPGAPAPTSAASAAPWPSMSSNALAQPLMASPPRRPRKASGYTTIFATNSER